MCLFTIVVVLRENKADEGPAVAACSGSGSTSAAPHFAELLRQS